MEVTVAKTFDDIPKEFQKDVERGKVFHTKIYEDLAQNLGAKMWYCFDAERLLPVEIFQNIGIKYAIFMVEPLVIGETKISQDRFLDSVIEALKRERIAWVTVSAAAFFTSYPINSMRIPFGSHVIDLTQEEEQILMKMHSKHRNSIRRAERENVEIKIGGKELVDDYELVDRQTWNRSNRDEMGKSFFGTVLDSLKGNANLAVAYKDGIPQAGACIYVNEQMAYYMYGASADSPEPGSSNLLHWELIKKYKSDGVKKYSFVGCRINEDPDSKFHNIQRFKERFGGELVQGYNFKSVLMPAEYKAYRIAYRIKHKAGLSDVIDQEISKWVELQQ